MNESHLSLRDDYKVSCHELDLIRDFATTKATELASQKALKAPAIIGPRMMGGGFGGSTIQLVHNSILDEFVSYFEGENNAYQKETNISPSVIVTKLSEGLRFI